MNQAQLHIKDEKFLKRINNYLFIILLTMIWGYFTISENVALTQAFKIVSRLSMTVLIFYLTNVVFVKKGMVKSFQLNNPMASIMYYVYMALAFVSFMWSTKPSFSILQWIMTAESLVFSYFFLKAYFLLDIFYPENRIKFYATLGNASFVIITFFVVMGLLFPDEAAFMREVDGGNEIRLGGWMMNPNELGMLCGVGASSLIFNLYRKQGRIFNLIKILIIVYALVLTKSRSSLIGFLLIVFFHIRGSQNTSLKLMVYIGTALVVPVAVEQLIMRSGGLEDILSMTGRMPFWKALITEGLPREPLLGFGYMRIDYHDHFESVNTYAGHMAHNTFVQVLMSLGFIGFGIILFQMFFTIRGMLNEKKENRLMLLGILIPVFINSLTEFGIFGHANYGILFYQLMVFAVSFKPPQRYTRKELHLLKLKRPDLFQIINPSGAIDRGQNASLPSQI